MNDYVAKPVDMDELKQVTERVTKIFSPLQGVWVLEKHSY
jgi:two-component SAPR family response regulator